MTIRDPVAGESLKSLLTRAGRGGDASLLNDVAALDPSDSYADAAEKAAGAARLVAALTSHAKVAQLK